MPLALAERNPSQWISSVVEVGEEYRTQVIAAEAVEPAYHHAVHALKTGHFARGSLVLEGTALWSVRAGPQVLGDMVFGGLRRCGTVLALIDLIGWEVDLLGRKRLKQGNTIEEHAGRLTTVKSLPVTTVFTSEGGSGSHEPQGAYQIDMRGW